MNPRSFVVAGLLALGSILLVLQTHDSRAAARLRGLRRPADGERSSGGGGDHASVDVVRSRRLQGRSLVSAAVAGFGGLLLVGPAGLLAASLPLIVQRVHCAHSRRQSRLALEEAIPEAIEVLAEAVRAKGSLRLAVAEVARAGPTEVRPLFDEVCRRLESGYDLDGAASVLGRDATAHGLRQALLAIRLHTSSGGNLAGSLETVARWARGRVSVERELRASTAQGRFSGFVVALAPIGFALVSHAAGLGGDFLFNSPAGLAALVVGLLLDVGGFLWIRRVCEVRW